MRRKFRLRPADRPQPPAGDRSISAHGDISGIASTGDFATNVQAEQATVLPPFRSASEVAAPPGLVNLPVRPTLFVGRDQMLTELRTALTAGSGLVVVTVAGLGGIGKSTLAARYAATCSADHALVWWITADTPAAIDTGLAALAVALQPALSRALPLGALREWALQWLACHNGWLLVLDNVNDPADIAPLTGRLGTGRFLITSRLAVGWHGLTSSVVRLDVLSVDNAVELLTQIVPGQTDSAGELCTELGCLPLAIEQAGAYIAETAINPRAYLALLAEYPAAMFESVAAAGDPGRTIARIWRVTLDRLADDPLAGQILRILAWYAPDPIPRALLNALADIPDLHRAIGRLAAYSMLTSGDDMTVTVHRLVQAVARTPDAADPHRAAARIDDARVQATTLVDGAIPPVWADPGTWPTWRTLLPHIDALAGHAPASTDTTTMAHLLNRTGLFLINQGALARAIRFFSRALTGFVHVLGEDHPDTLNSRNSLACAYQGSGDLGRAISLFEQVLADRRRVLGEDHPDTLTSRNNLALAYQEAGDLGRTIPLFEQVLADRRVLGEDHPDTLASRNNLAYAYQEAGDLSRAIPLYERTISDERRVLGEDHPTTLTSRNNVADAYRVAGDLGRAISLFEQVLADRRRVLGEDHPDTLASRNNLAYTYQEAGDLSRAIPLYDRTISDERRVLGEDHPTTLTSRNNVADAYRVAGDLGRAISLFEQVLADRRRVLGKDHPDTLNSRHNLARSYQAASDFGRAISLFKQVLADQRRVLGKDHPDTLTSRNNLAGAYQEAGDLDRAIPLHKQVLADRRRVLGKDHPDTLNSRHNLAYAYQGSGDLGRAIPLHKQVLADRRRVLGKDHPDTLISSNNLAGAYEAAGDLDRAIPLYEQTLTDCVRVLGEDHPTSAVIQGNLAAARRV